LFVAEGRKGSRVYDVASIANKGVSQRLITAPFSPLGQEIRIPSKAATCIVLPTNQPIQPSRNEGPLMRETNQEQPFHPLYRYAYITDASEGLILVDIDTLMDGDPRNNNLERALTWNENGVLKGARHLVLGGRYAYVAADVGVVILNLDQPLEPRVIAVVPMPGVHSVALQFRYLFVTNREGFTVIDVTQPEAPALTTANRIPLRSARRIHLARTYAYVAAGSEGLAIIDIEKPEAIKLYGKVTEGLSDASDVTVASTNASLFAYVADGAGGLKVFQLTAPDTQPNFYGFSPEPRPQLIAWHRTSSPARALSRGLERDRGVDETGGQVAVFGRIGSRPLNEAEMKRLYLSRDGKPWYVEN
ncbi:MAG: LVIVD repeat-containing protein, partial [Pseudomonadales bacterium]